MDCADEEVANLQSMQSAASDTLDMECSQDTQVMQTQEGQGSVTPNIVRSTTIHVGECDENKAVCSKSSEKEQVKEDDEQSGEKEENVSKRRKQEIEEEKKDEENKMEEKDEEEGKQPEEKDKGEEKKMEENDSSDEEKYNKEFNFPDTLEGFRYHFNKDGQLRDMDKDEPFQFVIRSDDHFYNQKRYEAIGDILNQYVYDLMETECNLKKITIPIDAADGEPTSFVFASEHALTTTGKLLVLIHGSGVVRAGQWARRLIMNDCLDSGTQIPYIKRAIKEGYEVLVLNSNENESEDGTEIRGSETPGKHALYVFEHLLKKEHPGKQHIAIVAHSYGGCVVLSLIEKNLLEKPVFAIALTDSVHQLHYQVNHPLQQSWLLTRARNWVSSDKQLDEFLPLMAFKNDITRHSAGTKKHEETSSKAMEPIFKFIKSKEPSGLQKKGPPAGKGDATSEEEKRKDENGKGNKSEEKK